MAKESTKPVAPTAGAAPAVGDQPGATATAPTAAEQALLDQITALRGELAAVKGDRSKDEKIAKLTDELNRLNADKSKDETIAKLTSEMEKVFKENIDHLTAKKRRLFAMRKLAAAVLVPADESDRGAARRVGIRDALLALVEELAPEE